MSLFESNLCLSCLKMNKNKKIKNLFVRAHGDGRVVSAFDSETSVSTSMPANAIICNAYTSVIKKKFLFVFCFEWIVVAGQSIKRESSISGKLGGKTLNSEP